jgi:hypothetical protein
VERKVRFSLLAIQEASSCFVSWGKRKRGFLIPFLVRRIILCLRPHPKLSRYGTAIEESLKASSRSVLPALQAGSGCSDSQEMAGPVEVTARGAIEAGERGGDQPQADSAGVQGVVGDHAAFHKAKVVGEVGLRRIYQPPYSPELNPAERVLEEVRR